MRDTTVVIIGLFAVLSATQCGGAAAVEDDAPEGIQPAESNDARCPTTTPTHLSTDDEYCYDADVRCAYESAACHDVFVCTCYEGCGWLRDEAAQTKPACAVPCAEADASEPCASAEDTCGRPGEDVNGIPGTTCTATCDGAVWLIECPMP